MNFYIEQYNLNNLFQYNVQDANDRRELQWSQRITGPSKHRSRNDISPQKDGTEEIDMEVRNTMLKGLGSSLHHDEKRAAGKITDDRNRQAHQEYQANTLMDNPIYLLPILSTDPLAHKRDNAGSDRQRRRFEEKCDLPRETDSCRGLRSKPPHHQKIRHPET